MYYIHRITTIRFHTQWSCEWTNWFRWLSLQTIIKMRNGVFIQVITQSAQINYDYLRQQKLANGCCVFRCFTWMWLSINAFGCQATCSAIKLFWYYTKITYSKKVIDVHREIPYRYCVLSHLSSSLLPIRFISISFITTRLMTWKW